MFKQNAALGVLTPVMNYQHISALSQWKRQQGAIHCYQILFNNIKSVRWKQIRSLWVGVSGWQHSSPSGSGGASARCTSVSEPQDEGEHDRTTSPPVEGKGYCWSNVWVKPRVWLMQVKVCQGWGGGEPSYWLLVWWLDQQMVIRGSDEYDRCKRQNELFMFEIFSRVQIFLTFCWLRTLKN